MAKRIALLATGDEVVNGDILNHNGQEIAHALFSNGMVIGHHMVVNDQPDAIAHAFNFLRSEHDAVIVTGGLGPTSDDRTRFVIADALNMPLEFNAPCWSRIEKKLNAAQLEIHPSNRQQAYFPANAILMANEYGTAEGCAIPSQDQWVILLPGPPRECMPMFKADALPLLKQQGYAGHHILKRWYLLGAVEAHIAAAVDDVCAPYGIQTGYRANTPYLEVKLVIDTSNPPPAALEEAIQCIVSPYDIGTQGKKASTALQEQLENPSHVLSIFDDVTGHQLACTLFSPKTKQQLNVLTEKSQMTDSNITVIVEGLEKYTKQSLTTGRDELSISIFHQGKCIAREERSCPIRGKHTRIIATELICFVLLKHGLKNVPA